MRFVWATASHVGMVREGNEDDVYPRDSGSGPGPLLIAVADGMGGHVAGEVASRLAMEAAIADGGKPSDRVAAANRAVVEAAAADDALNGMGTTLTLAGLQPDGTLDIAHVGDSRAYLYRDGSLRLLTEDHTVVAELVALGHLSEEAAANHPQRHLLTRTLGLGPVEVHQVTMLVEPGDRLLLCSDGLTTMLEAETIEALLEAGLAVEPTVWSLIEAANAAGGVDNTTVALVDITT